MIIAFHPFPDQWERGTNGIERIKNMHLDEKKTLSKFKVAAKMCAEKEAETISVGATRMCPH